MTRTAEESLRLIDLLVGRCVRDPEFAAAVLADPDATLSEYALSQDELDDFRVLSKRDHRVTLSGWAKLRQAIEGHRSAVRRSSKSILDESQLHGYTPDNNSE